MRHLPIILTLAALAAFFVAPSWGAKPPPGAGDPLTLTTNDVTGGAGFVEQQSPLYGANWQLGCNLDPSTCVANPGPCLWTADSRATYMGFGNLDAGASASAATCVFADWFQHILGLRVTSGSPGLIVKVRYEPQGIEYVLPSRPVSGGYEYRGCVVGPYYSGTFNDPSGPHDPQLQPISGSNGGVALRTDFTVTVANPTGRKERNVSAQFVMGSSEPGRQGLYCQGGSPGEAFAAGGAIWKTGL